jgi:hypothetical protein
MRDMGQAFLGPYPHTATFGDIPCNLCARASPRTKESWPCSGTRCLSSPQLGTCSLNRALHPTGEALCYSGQSLDLVLGDLEAWRSGRSQAGRNIVRLHMLVLGKPAVGMAGARFSFPRCRLLLARQWARRQPLLPAACLSSLPLSLPISWGPCRLLEL